MGLNPRGMNRRWPLKIRPLLAATSMRNNELKKKLEGKLKARKRQLADRLEAEVASTRLLDTEPLRDGARTLNDPLQIQQWINQVGSNSLYSLNP